MPNSARDVYGTGKKKPKPKRRPPSPPPLSEVAASGGVQTNRKPPPVPFTPIPAGPALHPQRQQVREQVRRAEDRLPPALNLPRRPILAGGYTAAQRKDIINSTSKAIRKALADGSLDEYLVHKPGEEELYSTLGHLTDKKTRTAIHKYAGALRTVQRDADAALGARSIEGRLSPVYPSLANLVKIGRQIREQGLADEIAQHSEIKPGGTPTGLDAQLSGFIDDRVFNYAPGLRLLSAPVQLGRAFVEDPVGTTKASIRTGVESIAGIPQGLYTLATDPEHAIEAIGEDYKHRYGPLLEGNTAKFREQVQDESGLTPFALDAGAVGAPAGRVATVAARTGAVARTAEALATAHEPILSRVLKAAHETATMRRPGLRFSGGEGGVRPQATSPNLFVAAGQRGLDSARRRAFERRANRAGLRPTSDGRLERIPGASEDGRLPGLRPGADEVLPYYSPREGATRRLTGRVARDIGDTKSKARLRLLTRRAEALHDLERQMKHLSPDEAAVLMPVIKYGLPAVVDDASRVAAVRAIERRLGQIKRKRKSTQDSVLERVVGQTNDEVALLRDLRDEPEAYLTPRVRKAADEIIAIQRREESLDPDLTPERALIRRDRPQGAMLGIRRGPDDEHFRQVLEEVELVQQARGSRLAPGQLQESHGELARMMPEDRPAVAKRLQTRAQAQLRSADRDLAAAKEELANAQGRAEVLSRNVEGSAGEAAAVRAGKDPDRLGRRGTGRPLDVLRFIDDADAGRYAAGGQGVAEARRAVDEATARRAAAADAYKAAQEVTKATESPSTMRLESAEAFDKRVRKAAEEEGLAEPGYWMSTARPSTTYSNAAVGTGGRAVAGSKAYTGALHDIGAETHTPDVVVSGIERNIKRRFSWALVSRNVETHAFEWSRGKHGEGLTASQLLHELDRRHIDERSVSFLNARVVRRRDTDEHAVERGTVHDAGQAVEDDLRRQAGQEFAGARRDLAQLQAEEAMGQAMNRYLVVPKEVADELEFMASPGWLDGGKARALEIVFKNKPARLMLGLFNVPWLGFQVASNALLTGLGGGRNPLDVYGAHKWWRGLTGEEKDAIEVELGITRGRHFGMDHQYLGSTKTDFGDVAQHFINFWHAYKKSKVGRMAHRVNPLDAFFRLDEAQNNFFRKVLFYNQAKRTAYKRMGASWKSMDGIQKKLMRALAVPPEKLGGELVRKGPEFEAHAKAVNDFLGNYLTFSNAERLTLSRAVMFYGYLRFSLRFTFWTMPAEHPVTTAILANVGRMGAQEIKELFGVPRGDRLPTSSLARLYWGASPKQVAEYVKSEGAHGKLPSSFGIGSMNPGLNALTQIEGAHQVVGLASPLYQMVADQLFEESSFTGRDFQINGKPTPYDRPKNYYGSFWSTFIPGRPRNRIALSDLLGLTYPYRLATKVGVPGVVDPLEGPQSDDSLLWDQRPIEYSDEKIRRSIKRSIERAREHRSVLPELVRVTREDVGPLLLAREREREAAAAVTPEERKKKKEREKRQARRKAAYTSLYGGGSSGNAYGGSSSDSYGYGGSKTDWASRYGG